MLEDSVSRAYRLRSGPEEHRGTANFTFVVSTAQVDRAEHRVSFQEVEKSHHREPAGGDDFILERVGHARVAALCPNGHKGLVERPNGRANTALFGRCHGPVSGSVQRFHALVLQRCGRTR